MEGISILKHFIFELVAGDITPGFDESPSFSIIFPGLFINLASVSKQTRRILCDGKLRKGETKKDPLWNYLQNGSYEERAIAKVKQDLIPLLDRETQ